MILIRKPLLRDFFNHERGKLQEDATPKLIPDSKSSLKRLLNEVSLVSGLIFKDD